MSELLTRARAALEGVSPGPWEMRDGYVYPLGISARLGGIWPADAEFIAASRQLIPELIAALERLSEWNVRLATENVVRAAECVCEHDPSSPQFGPSEVCPHHGRTYQEWVERGDLLQRRLAELETVLAQVRETAEYWTSGVIGQPDKPAHHQALRQGGHHILGLIEKGLR